MYKKPKFIKTISWVLMLLMGMGNAQLLAQTVMPLTTVNGEEEKLIKLLFNNSPIDIVLDQYSRITGKTLIKAPNVPAINVNLKSQTRITETEALVAIETLLSMNNIALVTLDKNFIKVIQAPSVSQEAPHIVKPGEEKELSESDNVVSQIVELEHITIQEALPILQNMIHSYGKLQNLERSNAILITDTEANLREINDMLKYIDKPFTVREEPRVYELKYAKASDVASRLKEIIAESQKNQQTGSTSTRSTSNTRTASSLRRRLGNRSTPATTSNPAQLAEKGIIQGTVQIVSDERTNIMIVISDPVNFPFFDRIVDVLDRAVDPELTVKVFPLEFADAKEISGVLNDLIGAATSDSDASSASGGASTGNGTTTRSRSLQDFVAQRRANTTQNITTAVKGSLSQISENTRILADERTNSLLIMGRGSDIAILEGVIGQLDVMLAQVLIEAVILEVRLSDSVDYGFDWLQRSLTGVDQRTAGPRGGLTISEPVFAFGGGQNLGNGTLQDASQVTRATEISAGGLTYFATFFDFNVDALVRLAAGSSDAKILSSPVILTTDNKEAEITVGEQRPIPTTSSTTAGGVIRSTFEYRDIGIKLTVTPRINPNGFVIMEVSQSADNVGGTVTIDGNEVPIITRREMQATIGVSNRTTIVLGGLVSEDDQDTITKVPFLGDIPILGSLFRRTNQDNSRSEILVLLTPYVLTTTEEAVAETLRLHRSTKIGDDSWYRGWSDGNLSRQSRKEEEETLSHNIPPDRYYQDPQYERPVTWQSADNQVETVTLEPVAEPYQKTPSLINEVEQQVVDSIRQLDKKTSYDLQQTYEDTEEKTFPPTSTPPTQKYNRWNPEYDRPDMLQEERELFVPGKPDDNNTLEPYYGESKPATLETSEQPSTGTTEPRGILSKFFARKKKPKVVPAKNPPKTTPVANNRASNSSQRDIRSPRRTPTFAKDILFYEPTPSNVENKEQNDSEWQSVEPLQ